MQVVITYESPTDLTIEQPPPINLEVVFGAGASFGAQGPEGPQGPPGPQGDPGVYVSATPPPSPDIGDVWIDIS